jgi:hypothetical protein
MTTGEMNPATCALAFAWTKERCNWNENETMKMMKK